MEAQIARDTAKRNEREEENMDRRGMNSSY